LDKDGVGSDYSNVILQVGVLKRRKKGRSRQYVNEMLPPKPVIMGFSAEDIKKLVYITRLHVIKYMQEKDPSFKEGMRLTSILPSSYGPLITQVNTFLKTMFPDGAIVGYSKSSNDIKPPTTHALRRFYANYSYKYHARHMVKNVWIMAVLGHDTRSLATSLSYTGAIIRDTKTHFTPIPQGQEGEARMIYNGLQNIQDSVVDAVEKRLAAMTHSRVDLRDTMPLNKKRKRNNGDDGDKLIAVLEGPPLTIEVSLPAREAEVRLENDNERAAVVKDYVTKNFRFKSNGHTYICKPTRQNLVKFAHFGNTYAKAFAEHEQAFMDAWNAKYDAQIETFV
jgi:hypothetical protein